MCNTSNALLWVHVQHFKCYIDYYPEVAKLTGAWGNRPCVTSTHDPRQSLPDQHLQHRWLILMSCHSNSDSKLQVTSALYEESSIQIGDESIHTVLQRNSMWMPLVSQAPVLLTAAQVPVLGYLDHHEGHLPWCGSLENGL